jgi:hypothetical protein
VKTTRDPLRPWPACLALGLAAAVLPALSATAAAATQEHGIGTFSKGDRQLTIANTYLGSGFSNKLNLHLTTNLGVDGLFTSPNTTRSRMHSFTAQRLRMGVTAWQDFLIADTVAPTDNSVGFGAQHAANLAPGTHYVLTRGDGGGRSAAPPSSQLPIASAIGPAVSPVPEPQAWATMLAGLLLMSMRVHRWKQRTAQRYGGAPDVLIRTARDA